MTALTSLNLVVLLSSQVPGLAEASNRDEQIKQKFHGFSVHDEASVEAQDRSLDNHLDHPHGQAPVHAWVGSGPSAPSRETRRRQRATEDSCKDPPLSSLSRGLDEAIAELSRGSSNGSGRQGLQSSRRAFPVSANASGLTTGTRPAWTRLRSSCTSGGKHCDNSDSSAPQPVSIVGRGSMQVSGKQVDGLSALICTKLCGDFIAAPDNVRDLLTDQHDPAIGDVKTFTLVMSNDNVAAIGLMCSLSILGAIYLWTLCTRKRCVCRLCRGIYRDLGLIGSGGYGAVHLVERPPPNGDGLRFVSKKIPVLNITEVDEYSREAKELITLRHRHIVSYEDDFVHVEYGALEPKTFFCIVMEYCPEGDLKMKIEDEYASFTEEWIRTLFAQLLQAVQYLHSKNVIHRDLKSQNVFLAHDGRVRLGDFGLCRHTARTAAQKSASMTHAGTDCYMAPEMLSSSKYGKPADVWSLGCVLYEMCTGQFMWELEGILGAMVMKDPQSVSKLVKSNMAPCIGSAMTALLKRLLSSNPLARPSVTACIRKKIFKRNFPLSQQCFGDALDEADSEEKETPRSRRHSGGNAGSERTQPSRSQSSGESTMDASVPARAATPSLGNSGSDGEDDAHTNDSSSEGEELRMTTRNSDLPKRNKKRLARKRVGRR